ncbi:nadp:d-xylose dehydrogenase [Colletotrichum plurivorum]|uniref:Nadp:d-xylose dehydrogenase n=1 Tax=Colletotrichum plurivorum TaxID=2175906 RepID=A0A8H6KCA1_9PEZI|nr:nadp:d-xylose dehydrogenase [Colletotrichum plurivorum]
MPIRSIATRDSRPNFPLTSLPEFFSPSSITPIQQPRSLRSRETNKSFGVGIGDCYLVLRGLGRCTRLLRGEARDGFADHAQAYKSFANGAVHLREFLKGEQGRMLKPHLSVDLENLDQLLRDFLARIRRLELDLGVTPEDSPRRLRRIFRMLRWPVYDAVMSGICHKLSATFDMIKFVIDLRIGSSIHVTNPCPPAGLPKPPDIGPRYLVETITLNLPQDLATFIENVFCAGHRTCLAVEHRSYLLRNNTTEETFLVNSPSVPSWEDAIKNGDEVEMSVLFPNRTSYNDFCPKCKKAWSSPLSLEMIWCGLSARFLDSFDDEPDPVTSIALEDVRRTGLRKFFDESAPVRGACNTKDMKRTDAFFEETMNAWIRRLKKELGPRPMAPIRHDRLRIKDFRRIAICNEQWPDLAKAVDMVDSSASRLRAVIQGLKRHAELLGTEKQPLDAVASIIGSRCMGARARSEMRLFFQSIVRAYTDRQNLWLPGEASLSLLEGYDRRTRDAKAQFNASVIRLRCLLWIYSETLVLNADLMRGCCGLFNHFTVPEGTKQCPASYFEQFCLSMFIPQIIVERLTYELAVDIATSSATAIRPPTLSTVLSAS